MCKDDYFQGTFSFEDPVRGPVKLQKGVITSEGIESLKRISGYEQDIEDE